MAQAITSSNIEELINSGKPLVLDFSATWCGPCKRVAPLIDKLAEAYQEQAIIGKIDIEEEEDLAAKYSVRNIPTILYIKNGEVVDKQVGLAPLATLEEKLKAIL